MNIQRVILVFALLTCLSKASWFDSI